MMVLQMEDGSLPRPREYGANISVVSGKILGPCQYVGWTLDFWQDVQD